MDSTPQDQGVSPSGIRPSLLSPASAPAISPGVRLLDAIDPNPAPAAGKSRSKVLWGVTGAALLGGLAAWMVSAHQPGRASGPVTASARTAPHVPASTPASADAQTMAAASATPATSVASSVQVAATPAQIVAMAATPQDSPQRAEEGNTSAAPGAATALAADSLSERPAASPAPAASAASRKTAPKKSSAKTVTAKKGSDAGNGGSGAKPRTKSARQRAEPDPDADVVAAIMASMDRQAAAAAKPASQAATRRP